MEKKLSSGTDQNPYPICWICGVELSPQDSRGWEHLAKGGDGEEVIDLCWLCPNCIYEFVACKDVQQNEINTNYLLQEKIRKMKVILQDIINDIGVPDCPMDKTEQPER